VAQEMLRQQQPSTPREQVRSGTSELKQRQQQQQQQQVEAQRQRQQQRLMQQESRGRGDPINSASAEGVLTLVHNSLKHGVSAYNQGRIRECADGYEAVVLQLCTLLTGQARQYAKMKHQQAEAMTDDKKRAWLLRETLDTIKAMKIAQGTPGQTGQTAMPPMTPPMSVAPPVAAAAPGGDFDLARLRQLFDRVDRNRDGQVNKRELILALRNESELCELLELPANIRQEDGSRALFEQLFQGADLDENRELSWEEFSSACVQRLALRTARAKAGTGTKGTERFKIIEGLEARLQIIELQNKLKRAEAQKR
jgi:hypothetical protein